MLFYSLALGNFLFLRREVKVGERAQQVESDFCTYVRARVQSPELTYG